MAKGLLVINVLPAEYYQDCRITGSIHVPLESIENISQTWSKDSMIVVYCARYACTASIEAYKQLKELGFSQVFEYAGGMAEWKHMNLPSEGACRLDYLQQNDAPTTNPDLDCVTFEQLQQYMKNAGML